MIDSVHESAQKTCDGTTFVGLWVDDVRPVPDDLVAKGWCSARSAWEALVKLELINFNEVSLDHDLASFVGHREITGYDILLWLAQRKQDGLYVPSIIKVHSANPVGRKNMMSVITRYLS